MGHCLHRNLGCGNDHCKLCMNNPKRRCTTNFGKGYVDEDLRAKCNAPIRVEVIDKATGHKILQDIFDVMLEAGRSTNLCYLSRASTCTICCPISGCLLVLTSSARRLEMELLLGY